MCVGVQARGLLGRRLDPNVAEALGRLRGLGGKHVAAFVCAGRVGGEGALHALMALLEGEGAFVRDFQVLRHSQGAREFGARLTPLLPSPANPEF